VSVLYPENHPEDRNGVAVNRPLLLNAHFDTNGTAAAAVLLIALY
jgi:hypothetical protein